MHRRIDDGLQWCAKCDRFGWHTFCGQCGKRYLGGDLTWRECPRCKARVTTDYCSLCGAPVYDELMKQYDMGTIDFAAKAEKAKRILREQFKPEPVARTPSIVAALQEVLPSRRA